MNIMKDKKTKNVIVILVISSLFLIITELILSQMVSTDFSMLMQKQRQSSVSKMVHLAYNTIQPILDDVRLGTLDKSAAREEIITLVRKMTYTDEYGKNYIFMSSYDGVMLVQPFETRKEGSYQWDLQDVNGKYIIQELVKAAKETPSGAYVSYHYYIPEENRVEEKMSYVMGIPEIDAYIGTGMYPESAYQDLEKVLKIQRYGFLFVTVSVIIAAALYIRILIKANDRLSVEIQERMYAESNIRTVFDSIHDTIMIHDNGGVILQANKRAGALFGIPVDRITDYSVPQLCADGYEADEKLQQADTLEMASMVFEWKFKRPHDGNTFDGEVALRKSIWSGDEVIVSVIRDISERKKHEDEIRYLAYCDYLTSLYNRVYIMNELRKEFDAESNEGVGGAILFIDLDNFKKINDSFGHFFGDEVLVELAERLRELANHNLIPARIGGDEFVILYHNADRAKAALVAENVLSAFRRPIMLRDTPIHITCSIGISLFPDDGRSVEDLFKKADLALYSAKDKGKDSFCFYEEILSLELQFKSEMEEQMRLAFTNDEFMMHFQPMFDIKSRKIKGYEALLRWDSTKYGVVSPGVMIPLAEEIGLIKQIGDWVIDKAFAFAQQTQLQGLYISCNVSSIQLSQNDFVENVLAKYDQYKLKKGSIALEITESCLIESFDEASQKLTSLRGKGILVYLDDFGTGYSSLNYLKNLPADIIKIDKCFIDEIANSGVDSKILKTIISLVHDMGIKTVAEGVETEDQLRFLETCGCDLIQGFLISKPIPEAQVRAELGL
ncbi:MAG: domain S-box/diguanylate cyclase protein [Bacillota bacterium]|nr:domain S-box/diguanylate cyclase protein [Bacillota bacterium]